jgi:predicted nucleic acid-binding protein
MYTIDASVWINSSDTVEPGHDVSRQLLQELAARGLQLVLPTLVLPEVAGSVARTRNDTARGQSFAQGIAALPQLTLVPVDDALATEALALAATNRLRGADAVYAAVALRHGTTLVSLDREHLTRLSGILPVLTPADALAALPPLDADT